MTAAALPDPVPCTGDSRCAAAVHVHGCYADHVGHCDSPYDHDVTDAQLVLWADQDRNLEQRLIPPLVEPGNCEGCEEVPAVAYLSWFDSEGREHQPVLCTACIERNFREGRLLRALIAARAALGARS